jgi:hypothetical protein
MKLFNQTLAAAAMLLAAAALFSCQKEDTPSTVNVDKEDKVTLVSGASLYYSGTPVFQIDKIVKSTLAPYGTK